MKKNFNKNEGLCEILPLPGHFWTLASKKKQIKWEKKCLFHMHLLDASGRVLDEGGAKAQLQRVEGG